MILKKKTIVIGSCVVVLLLATAVFLEATNRTRVFHKQSVTQTASDATKGELSSQKANNDTANPETPPSSTTGNTNDSMPAPDAPNGVFVSNHHPNLSGSPAPNQINSVCTTTSGASCTIVFTNGSVIKSLPPETTDSGGSAYWTWKLQDIGLTEGTWKVQAKATLGSQTKTANDLMDLVVKK
jgi:hypothetical protein